MTWRTSMRNRTYPGISLLLLLAILHPLPATGGGDAGGRGVAVLFEEDFDTIVPPALPRGWRSSSARVAGAPDLVTSASSPASPPHAVAGSNSTVEQWLVSPSFDRPAFFPAVLSFSLRRSSTFAARCVVEASTDGGRTFGVTVGEAPSAFPSSAYELLEFSLPADIAASDSFLLRWHILPAATGTTATIRLDDVRLTRPRPPVTRGSVVINEIQSQPALGEGEWIELMNTGSDAVDIAGWGVRDSPTGTVHSVGTAPIVLPAGSLIVLAADSAAVRAVAGAGALIVQAAGFPSLNNTGDLVLVQDERGATMDSVRYDGAWGAGPGVSIERIDPHREAVAPDNWGRCLASAGATPGMENTIVLRPHDLRMVRIGAHRDALTGASSFHAVVHNAGGGAAPPCSVAVFSEADGRYAEALASGVMATGLAPRDSAIVECPWADPLQGRMRVRAEILWHDDQRQENNTVVGDVRMPLSVGVLRINEIQAGPVGGTAEFIEIVNASSVPVSVDGCFIADRRPGASAMRRWPVTDRSRVVAGGAMHVVAGDSSVGPSARLTEEWCTTVSRSGLGLNNDGDTVLLYSADSVLIDSVSYSSAWHSAAVDDPAGRSLERYDPHLASGDPRSWGTCVDPSGGTPGRANSIRVTVPPSDASLICAPDPFSPDADGRDDVTVLRYRLPVRSSLIRVRIFDIRGRRVRELVNAAPAAMTGEVVWDGMGDGREPLRIGIYVVHLESIDEAGGRMFNAACAVVLARRL